MNTERQPLLWTPPASAAIGEVLERLAHWCDSTKHMTFALQRTSVSRVLRRGGREEIRGWAVDVRRRGVVVHTISSSSLDELARHVGGWIDDQLRGVRQLGSTPRKQGPATP